MRDFLRRALVENFALKFVSLILAITLFILVHGERDAVIAAKIRVVYSAPAERVLMTEPVDEVRVRIRGSWTRVKRFDEGDVDPIYVDLRQVQDGEFFFEEDMIRLPPGLKITSISPPAVRLEFDQTAAKEVPISVVLEGTPARGYKVDQVTPRPGGVIVRGAARVVAATTSVETRKLDVTGRAETFTERVSLAPTERHLAVVDTPTVEVEVAVVPEQVAITLEAVPIKIVTPPGTGRRRVDPALVTLHLRGTKDAIAEVDRAKVVARVELHPENLGSSGGHQAEVHVDGLPTGVAAEADPREVSLVDAGK